MQCVHCAVQTCLNVTPRHCVPPAATAQELTGLPYERLRTHTAQQSPHYFQQNLHDSGSVAERVILSCIGMETPQCLISKQVACLITKVFS
jgi:hypothetical protein